MSEDKKKKSGLHKKISSIFEGVPLPQPGGLQQPPQPSAPQPAPGVPTRPLPPPFQALNIPQSQGYEAARRLAEDVSEGPAKTASKSGDPGLWQRIGDKLLTPQPGIGGMRQKMMLILVPLLFIVLIFIVVMVLKPSRPAHKVRPVKVSTPVAADDTTIEWKIPAVYPQELRDPTKLVLSQTIVTPPEPKPEPKPEPVKVEKLVVKGILYSEDNPSAIIGTQIVHQGDKISGANIVKIEKNSVVFERDGQKWKQGVEP